MGVYQILLVSLLILLDIHVAEGQEYCWMDITGQVEWCQGHCCDVMKQPSCCCDGGISTQM